MATYKDKILSMNPDAYLIVSEDPDTNYGSSGPISYASTAFTGTIHNRPMKTTGFSIPVVRSNGRSVTVPRGVTNDPNEWTFSLVGYVRSSDTYSFLKLPGQLENVQISNAGRAWRYRRYYADGRVNTTYYATGNVMPIPTIGTVAHYCLRRSAGSAAVQCFYNGTQVATITAGTAAPTADLVVSYKSYADYYGGPEADHYAYFNRALTDEEIAAQALYDGSPIAAETGTWTILENGLEVPITLEGAYENGSVIGVTPDANI